MALRRMFSKAVVSSARFMKMPVDSQNLYFHLGMAADDDGVVEAWSVLKTTGSAEDNLKVLASKGFIKVLNEDFVSYILDWNEHNLMRADRITPSAYRELLIQVVPDVELADPKQRADRPLRLGRPRDNHGTAEGRVGEDRIISASEDGQRTQEIREVIEVSDTDGELGDSKSPRISGDKKKAYDELIAWSENERGFPFPKTTRLKQYRAFKLANENGLSRESLIERWEEMSTKKFWQENGFDWMNVVQDLLKKPV